MYDKTCGRKFPYLIQFQFNYFLCYILHPKDHIHIPLWTCEQKPVAQHARFRFGFLAKRVLFIVNSFAHKCTTRSCTHLKPFYCLMILCGLFFICSIVSASSSCVRVVDTVQELLYSSSTFCRVGFFCCFLQASANRWVLWPINDRIRRQSCVFFFSLNMHISCIIHKQKLYFCHWASVHVSPMWRDVFYGFILKAKWVMFFLCVLAPWMYEHKRNGRTVPKQYVYA